MPSVIIFWHLVFALVGFLIGTLVGRWLERRSRPPAPVPAPVQVEIAAPKPSPANGQEILRAGRNEAGEIWLEIDGQQLKDKSALQSAQQGRLQSLLQELRPWIETGIETSIETSQPAQPQPAPVARPAPAAKVPPKQKKEAPAAPVMKTIVEQINDVLQAKLANTIFKDRGIQLVDGSGGSVMVEEGLNSYEGIEAVPNEEIRSLIRQAVSDWEKSAK